MISKKWVVILVVLLLICGIVAFAGLNTVTHEVEEAATKVEKQVRKRMEGKSKFVRLRHFSIPVVRRNTIGSHLSIAISLEVQGDHGVERVMASRRMLRDAILKDLMAAAYWPDIKTGYQLPVRAMKERLLVVSRQVLGPDVVVHDVLVATMIERKF
ncbi:MAG: hypothetical protein QNJ94_07400 [Alphaproteobacteria bacterium]|nr:hypothetical protein [Alphaproteobacteria bacterium]